MTDQASSHSHGDVPRGVTLTQRLFRLMLLAGLAAAGIVAATISVYEQTTFKPRFVTVLMRQATTLSAMLAPTLEFNDPTTAALYLETQRGYSEVAAVGLYSAAGAVVATYTRDAAAKMSWPKSAPSDGHRFIGNRIDLWYPVTVHDRTLGKLYIRGDLPPLYARLPQYGIMGGAVALALVAVSLLLLRGLRADFLQPLQALIATTERVTRHRDYDARARVAHNDELGQLAAALNEMLGTIQQRDATVRASESRLRSIIDNEPECVQLLGPKGELQDINPAGLKLLEAASFEEALRQSSIEYVARDDQERFRAMFRRVMQGASEGIEFELVGLRGGRHWLEARAVPMRDATGRIASVLAISRDITERKRYESALSRRNQQQAALIKFGVEVLSAPTAEDFLQRAADMAVQLLRADYAIILEVSPGGKVAVVRAAYGWTRWRPGAEWRIEPDTPTALVLNGDAVLLIQDFATDMRFGERVRDHRHDFRSTVAARIRTPALPWGLLAVHSKTSHSFTDDDVNALQELANLLAQALQRIAAENAQRRMEAQLLQSQKMEALGRLAGGIAHDFNNLLSAILGNVQLAREDVGVGHSAIVSLDEIQRAGQRSKELVQRILAFSRFQPPHRESIRLQPIVLEVGRLLRATIPAGIELQVRVDDEAAAILADAVQVHQCLLNLGTNAWQAIQSQPGAQHGTIELALIDHIVTPRLSGAPLPPGRYVRIEVRDTGAGIDAQHRDHIFEPFFTTKPLGEGTGLGLSVVHGIMQAHDGGVGVVSEPGRGSVFTLFFPVAADDSIPTMVEQPRIGAAHGEGEHILYIDDEEPLVFLATRLLERMGYRVSGFTRAADALAAFERSPDAFDLVVTDLSMPGLSGMEVAQSILAIRPDAAVVLASGYLRQSDIDAARAIGIREVVLKPNTVDELGPIVQRLLSRE